MFKATPIGSCRITGPLRHGADDHGFDLNLARCYGYCHSPAEAVQLARFMLGGVRIAPDIWPLVSPSRSQPVVEAEVHDPSDLYVIELASAKQLTIDGVNVQLNYLNSTYRDFFSDPARAQAFWAHASGEDPAAVSDFLTDTWSADEAQRRDARMLSRISLRMATRESLRRDIETLADMLPNVLFVSHVDARKSDGQTIASRSAFVAMVAEEVTDAGLPFFDPTTLMDEFGQEDAIEDHSTSLAHFTTPFSRAIVDDWVQRVIAPLTDRAVTAGRQGSALDAFRRQIAADRRTGCFARAQARLERAARHATEIAPLLDETAEEADAARSALKRRVAELGDGPLAAPVASELLVEAAMLGDFKLALGLAGRCRGGAETLHARGLMKAARLARGAEENETAFAFAYAALAGRPGLATAEGLIGDLLTEAPVAVFRSLSDEKAGRVLGRLAPLRRLKAARLQGRGARLALAGETAESDLADMVGALFEEERIGEAADLMAAWRDIVGADRLRDRDLTAMLGAWVEAAGALSDPLTRLSNLVTIARADPKHTALRKALRAHKSDLADRIRAAGRAADTAALRALADEVTLFPAPLPEFDLWQARLSFEQGEFGAALDHGRAAARDLPETISVWVLLMRAAVKLSDPGQARECAGRVIDLACDRTLRFKAEAEAVLASEQVAV